MLPSRSLSNLIAEREALILAVGSGTYTGTLEQAQMAMVLLSKKIESYLLRNHKSVGPLDYHTFGQLVAGDTFALTSDEIHFNGHSFLPVRGFVKKTQVCVCVWDVRGTDAGLAHDMFPNETPVVLLKHVVAPASPCEVLIDDGEAIIKLNLKSED